MKALPDRPLQRFTNMRWSGILLALILAGLVFAATVLAFALADKGVSNYGVINLLQNRERLKDAVEINLKFGTVVAALVGILRYWIRFRSPVLTLVRCGTIYKSVLSGLMEDQKLKRRALKILGLRLEDQLSNGQFDEDTLKFLHDLPLIVLHTRQMNYLMLREGSEVDLVFTLPDGGDVTAKAIAYSYGKAYKRTEASNDTAAIGESHAEGVERDPRPPKSLDDWPIGLSLSLKRLFRIERPLQKGADPATGWAEARVDASDLLPLHRIDDGFLKWQYNKTYALRHFASDTYEPLSPLPNTEIPVKSIHEYVGISLRVTKRTAIHFAAD